MKRWAMVRVSYRLLREIRRREADGMTLEQAASSVLHEGVENGIEGERRATLKVPARVVPGGLRGRRLLP